MTIKSRADTVRLNSEIIKIMFDKWDSVFLKISHIECKSVEILSHNHFEFDEYTKSVKRV